MIGNGVRLGGRFLGLSTPKTERVALIDKYIRIGRSFTRVESDERKSKIGEGGRRKKGLEGGVSPTAEREGRRTTIAIVDLEPVGDLEKRKV